MPSMVSSKEKTPTTKALSHSSGGSSSAASNSIKRPRTTAILATAEGTPAARDVVISSAAQRNSFFNPIIMMAWRNEVISQLRPNPAELINRSRLKDSVGSRLKTSSISTVLACLRIRLISVMMLTCAGRMVWPVIRTGLANQ